MHRTRIPAIPSTSGLDFTSVNCSVILLSLLLTVSTWQNLYAFDGKSREGTGQTAVEIDTCGTLLKYQVLLTFTGILGAVGTALILSAAAKSALTAFAGAAAVYFLPLLLPMSETSPLFRYLALLPLYHVQFTALMSIEQLTGNIP